LVVCNQTARQLKVSVDQLSKENGEDLTVEDLVDGNNVLYEDSTGKTFDVTIKGVIIHVVLSYVMYNYLKCRCTNQRKLELKKETFGSTC
jgi:hypothetical protein